jgi:hypothetical protein
VLHVRRTPHTVPVLFGPGEFLSKPDCARVIFRGFAFSILYFLLFPNRHSGGDIFCYIRCTPLGFLVYIRVRAPLNVTDSAPHGSLVTDIVCSASEVRLTND